MTVTDLGPDDHGNDNAHGTPPTMTTSILEQPGDIDLFTTPLLASQAYSISWTGAALRVEVIGPNGVSIGGSISSPYLFTTRSTGGNHSIKVTHRTTSGYGTYSIAVSK